jgi:hypothetical protein
MDCLMTVCTEGDQIFASVITQFASGTDVVHVQIRHAATLLTAPPVAFENLPVEFAVRCPWDADVLVSRS